MNMSSEHIVRAFDEDLQRLSAVVLRMGGVAEAQIPSAIEALVRRASELAPKVIAGDEVIDQRDLEPDDKALRHTDMPPPVAHDLREEHPAPNTSGETTTPTH